MKKVILSKVLILGFILVPTIILGFKSQEYIFKLPNSVKKQFEFIPSGKVFNGQKNVVTNDFFISKYEVSNKEYKEFLSSLKKQGKTAEYKLAQLDTNNWIAEFKDDLMRPFATYYHTHSAYDNYPVVNVSIEGAKLYCKWLSDKLNSENPKSDYTITVRLPNRNEWLRAANGNRVNSVYSWKGKFLRDEKGKFLCNFNKIGYKDVYFDENTKSYKIKNKPAEHIDKIGKLNDNFHFTSPVKSFKANDYKLYNLNGNVAELVDEGIACGGSWNSTGYDVRNQSTISYEKPSCMIGFRPLITIQ